MTKDIEQSITRLERRNRKLTWGLSGLLILWMATLATLFAFKVDILSKSLSQSTDEILRVRGLVIVDKNNTERVRKREKRRDKVGSDVSIELL